MDWLSYGVHALFGAVVGALLGAALWARFEVYGDLGGRRAFMPLGATMALLALNFGTWAGYLRDRMWTDDMMSSSDRVRWQPAWVRVTAHLTTAVTCGLLGFQLLQFGLGIGQRASESLAGIRWFFIVAVPAALGIVALIGGVYFVVRLHMSQDEP